MGEELIQIEVAYARPDNQVILECKVPKGTTLREAVELSGILEKFPDIDPSSNKMGIFGRISKSDAVLREKDRVEIYRPLIADPKKKKKKRAEKKERGREA